MKPKIGRETKRAQHWVRLLVSALQCSSSAMSCTFDFPTPAPARDDPVLGLMGVMLLVVLAREAWSLSLVVRFPRFDDFETAV